MKFLIILLCFGFFEFSFAQNHDNTWLLGACEVYSNGGQEVSYVVTFNPNYQQDTVTRNMGINAAQATMSDTAGNLLFYSNNCLINNYRHELMHNGDSLGDTLMWNFRGLGMGIDNTVALPHPDSTHLFYLLHISLFQANLGYTTDKLYYSLIDMNTKNGAGEVRLKNQLLYQSTAAESLDGGALKACKHANGKDWWILQPLVDTLAYATFLIKGDSVIRKPNQYFPARKIRTGGAISAAFSPDGTIYAQADDRLNIYNFNRCTGQLSYRRTPIIDAQYLGATGMAISANSRFLYMVARTDNNSVFLPRDVGIYQYDLEADDINGSLSMVIENIFDDTFCYNSPICTSWGNMQLAPDGKIYAKTSLNFLHVIHNPDEKGAACNPEMQAIRLNNSTEIDTRSVPNFPNYRLGAINPCVPRPVPNEGGEVISSVTENEAGAVKLYPNPARTEITIEVSEASGEMSIEIVDILGRVLSTTTSNQKTTIIQVSTLPAGLYSARLRTKRGLWTSKFIISK